MANTMIYALAVMGVLVWTVYKIYGRRAQHHRVGEYSQDEVNKIEFISTTGVRGYLRNGTCNYRDGDGSMIPIIDGYGAFMPEEGLFDHGAKQNVYPIDFGGVWSNVEGTKTLLHIDFKHPIKAEVRPLFEALIKSEAKAANQYNEAYKWQTATEQRLVDSSKQIGKAIKDVAIIVTPTKNEGGNSYGNKGSSDSSN